jgi:uncharacterized protein YbjT (DUF2867 family)
VKQSLRGQPTAFPAKRRKFCVVPETPAIQPLFARQRANAPHFANVSRVRILVTGVSGFVGAQLVPRLARDGHELRGFARNASRVTVEVPLVTGDALTGDGLAQALDGIDVAYYLLHSMEPPAQDAAAPGFAAAERTAAQRFGEAAQAAGVERIVYLGGLVPHDGAPSEHLASRLAVERILLAAAPRSTALRASIVIGARSRSFRFLVRLVERLPLLALPAWRANRTQPIDERDAIELLARAAEATPLLAGETFDIAGRDVVTYGELIERIRDLMLLRRPALPIGRRAPAGVASRVAAAIAGERHELVGPLMGGLTSDLLPRDDRALRLLGVRPHALDAAIEHALGAWERDEPLAAR